MPYIKVNSDLTVTLGGALLHTGEESEGWFLYEGETYEYSKWDDKEKKVIPDVPPIESLMLKVSTYINTVAKESGYDDTVAFTSYERDSVNLVYCLQADRFKKFRTEVWDYFFELYELAKEGKERIDSLTFVSSLPKYSPDVSSEEVVRLKRDRLLEDSDKLLLFDRWNKLNEEQQQAILDYREALRDIPLQEGFPENINWPTKP